MAVPLFKPEDLPAAIPGARENLLDYPLVIEGYGERVVSTVNTGSTHTILWVNEMPDDALFFQVSPLIENHELFPERTSVMWTRVISSGLEAPPLLDVRIWERGAGETLGCGTGACAAAVLALAQNKVSGDSVAVRSKGGTLHILSRGKDASLRMTGPAVTIYQGIVKAAS